MKTYKIDNNYFSKSRVVMRNLFPIFLISTVGLFLFKGNIVLFGAVILSYFITLFITKSQVVFELSIDHKRRIIEYKYFKFGLFPSVKKFDILCLEARYKQKRVGIGASISIVEIYNDNRLKFVIASEWSSAKRNEIHDYINTIVSNKTSK
ncbi:MAG: hypothetical protein N4A49_09020 [Marinifilaceae bacterium]|jgi:hypothetical protein|nr:hypothetical protein [Marinifilaceae bacterium]